MIKLKDLLKESSPGFANRKFGDPLPTLKDIAKKHQKKEEQLNEGISQGDIKVIDTHDIPSFKEPKHSYELVYVIKPKVIKVGGETKSTVRFLVKGKYGGRIVDIPIDALKKSNKFEKYKVRFKGDILPKFKRFIKGDKVLESINEGGMGILTSDQADILQGLVMKHKNKNAAAILRLVLKSGYFKGVDKKEMLGYIAGAKDFAKYMK